MDILIVVTAILQVVSLFYINIHQRPLYPLVITVYVGYTIIELWLAVAVSWYMILFVGINLWSIATAIVGWRNRDGIL